MPVVPLWPIPTGSFPDKLTEIAHYCTSTSSCKNARPFSSCSESLKDPLVIDTQISSSNHIGTCIDVGSSKLDSSHILILLSSTYM